MSVVDMPKTAEAEATDAQKGGAKKKLILVVVVLALVGGAGYWFFLKPAGPEKAPEPGAVVKLDAIQINLADDRYLKVGIALQATKEAGEEVDGSKALDQTIALFSGQRVDKLSEPEFREKVKKRLEQRLEEAYEGEVIGVYFTDFVTQ